MKDHRVSRKARRKQIATVRPQAQVSRSESVKSLEPRERSFPVVGVGASAGGLEAFTRLLEHLPSDTGMAFVLVQHLAPKHESALTELLAKQTRMPVAEVKDGMGVEPDHIYVIPPDTNMAVFNGVLHLIPRAGGAAHMPIDFFLQSLAQDFQDKAIGVILSGTATDGTLGLKAVKAEGGVTFAQDGKSAKYDSMPRSAIAAGCVDFVLPPSEIAKELTRIGSHPDLNHATAAAAGEPVLGTETDLEKVLTLLRLRTGVDFTHYKTATINRRIKRRMILKEAGTLRAYIQILQEDPSECEALYDDILIHVTSFFRDPQSFEVLKKKVFPAMLKDRSRELPVRVWVPGCSTGEDAYSILISLLEHLGETARNVPIQVFATDISEKSLIRAREGIYPEAIASQVSPGRLRRFFKETKRGYQISKPVRDSIVFARHDITKDPPYSRLDIVSCRNLLIFLGPVLQERVFRAFHYSLNSRGYLMLGSSETVGEFSSYFSLIDRKHRIYSKKEMAGRLPLDFARPALVASEAVAGVLPSRGPSREHDVTQEADRIVMENYSPPAVIVNQDLDVVQFRGHTGRYLDPAPGSATLSLLKMVRADLLFELRSAMQKAKKTNALVRKEEISFPFNGQTRKVNVEVIPLKAYEPGKRHFLILFEEAAALLAPGTGATEARRDKAKVSPEKREIHRLEQELTAAKDFLRSAFEDQEAINEELRTANEESLSTNEELQTTNEELETAKEELQSANEELTTLNDELQNRNKELSQTANDLRNVLSSAYADIVLVDRGLRIRFFTSRAERALKLMPADLGRPITDIQPPLDVHDLGKLIAEVIENGISKDLQAASGDGDWYSIRIRPYMTAENKVEGAVIVLTDITESVRAQQHKKAQELTRKLSIRQIQARDEERRKISQELHDTTGPGLAALVMNLGIVAKSGKGFGSNARAALRNSLELARQCAQEIRTLSYQLHPPLLDEAGLESALRWYVDGFARLSGVKVKLELAPKLGRLPKELEVTLFRILQEALVNIHRHSGSLKATVKLALDANRVVAEVKDEGRGLPQDVAEGLGIMGMRERVQKLGGQFAIASGEKGTTVEVVVPLTGGSEARGS